MSQVCGRVRTLTKYIRSAQGWTLLKPRPMMVQPRVMFSSTNQLQDKPSDVISNYPIPDETQLPEDIKQRMEAIKEKLGLVPNITRALTYNLAEARGFLDLYSAIMSRESGLSLEEKELLALVTSLENNCLYCTISHSAIHRVLSGNPNRTDKLVANWRLVDLTPREKSILEFAVDVLRLRPLTDKHYEQLDENGLTRDDALDIASVVSLFAYANSMSHALNVKVDEPFYMAGRK